MVKDRWNGLTKHATTVTGNLTKHKVKALFTTSTVISMKANGTITKLTAKEFTKILKELVTLAAGRMINKTATVWKHGQKARNMKDTTF